MKAILLAAGRGHRLGDSGGYLPKCLLPFGARRLIDYQIDALLEAGIRRAVMVVGYRKELIERHMAGCSLLQVSYVDNPDYARTNTAYSLWLARSHMVDDFIYLNADVLFHPEMLRRLTCVRGRSNLAVVRRDCGDEEVKVRLDPDNRIRAIGKQIPRAEAYGEFIGVARFARDMCPAFIRALAGVTAEPEGKTVYFENALQRIADAVRLQGVDVTDLPCIEIDFASDLHEARETIAGAIASTTSAHVPRILLYVERNLHLPFLEPLHDYLSEHYHAELAFCAPPYRPAKSGEPGFGLTPEQICRLRQKSAFVDSPDDFDADVAVVADATFYALRRCKKIINVGHGLICKGFFYTRNPIVRRENHASLICVPGIWHKERIEKQVYVPVEVTGFIKSDAMRQCTRRDVEQFRQKYGIPAGSACVLYAPTFNEDLGSIPAVREDIQRLADETTRVLIKLHGMTGMQYQQMYSALAERCENIALIDEDDFSAAMACADVLVSDVSSVFVEFMLLDKPVVLFNAPHQQRYPRRDADDIEYVVRDAATEVATVDELVLAVKLALLEPWARSSRRKHYARLLGCRTDGRSVKRTADVIMREAGSPPPVFFSDRLFSIIVMVDRPYDAADVEERIADIAAKSSMLRHEIICAGPPPQADGAAVPGVAAWFEADMLTPDTINHALQQARGDVIVLLSIEAAVPSAAFAWMYGYFRGHDTAGAVKALTDNEPYREILRKDTTGFVPDSPASIQDYFLYYLAGNDVPADELDPVCLMLSKDALAAAGGLPAHESLAQSVMRLGRELKQRGYSLWHALEVFVYSRPLEPVVRAGATPPQAYAETPPPLLSAEDLLDQACALKRDRRYAEAIDLLLQARAAIADGPGGGMAPQYGMSGGASGRAVQFIDQARACKQQRNYQQAIMLLNEARNIPGLCAGL